MSDPLAQIQALSDFWHQAGSVPDSVLQEMEDRFRRQPWRRSMETGCGRTTLLLSQLSERHTVFAFDGNDTSDKVFGSELLRRDHVEFVAGPTQRTVPAYAFREPFQLILLDGPHSYPFPELEYYFVYPHLETGGTLVIDDIWIPTIHRMYEFLREEPMFRLDKVVAHTAFFVRTDAPLFDPYSDNWQAQPFNRRRFPAHQPPWRTVKLALKRRVKLWLHAWGLRPEP
jgi:hypothetical protein